MTAGTFVEGDRVNLRVVGFGDYDAIRTAELEGEGSITFRHRGATPSPEQFTASLWSGVLNQYMVESREDGRSVGFVACYNPDFRNDYAYIGGMIFPAFRRSGWALEGFTLFIDSLFYSFPFRKLYGEVLEPNLANFKQGLGGVATEEGRLLDHEYLGGGYVDKVTLAIYRDSWISARTGEAQVSGLMRHLIAHAGDRDSVVPTDGPVA
jgi:RimJ/RimL family protein N-acetyltransferase